MLIPAEIDSMTDINSDKSSSWDDASLLKHLQRLELELHHPGVPLTAARIDALLHPDFHEVGRSGTAYSRKTVVRFLSDLTARPATVSDHFRLTRLERRSALLHFRSAERAAGAEPSECKWTHHAHRSSLWICEGDAWRLMYHQATPSAQPFVPELE